MTSFAGISESTVHDKKTALEYLHEVLLVPDLEHCEQLNIWSDWSSGQFKDRYITSSLPLMNAAYNCHTTHHETSSRHHTGRVSY